MKTTPEKQAHSLAHDPFLATLVETVNSPRTNISFAITLTVGGLVVSGNLISRRRYLEAFRKFVDGWKKGLKDAESAMTLEKSFPSLLEEEPGDGSPRYIHLGNASLSFPGQGTIPIRPGFPWRCKLTSVDGFHLGLLAS